MGRSTQAPIRLTSSRREADGTDVQHADPRPRWVRILARVALSRLWSGLLFLAISGITGLTLWAFPKAGQPRPLGTALGVAVLEFVAANAAVEFGRYRSRRPRPPASVQPSGPDRQPVESLPMTFRATGLGGLPWLLIPIALVVVFFVGGFTTGDPATRRGSVVVGVFAFVTLAIVAPAAYLRYPRGFILRPSGITVTLWRGRHRDEIPWGQIDRVRRMQGRYVIGLPSPDGRRRGDCFVVSGFGDRTSSLIRAVVSHSPAARVDQKVARLVDEG